MKPAKNIKKAARLIVVLVLAVGCLLSATACDPCAGHGGIAQFDSKGNYICKDGMRA